MTTPEQFEAACRLHDLTFSAADDFAAWKRGNESLKALHAMATELGLDVAIPIFNRIVDTKIAPHARADYYWSMPNRRETA